MNNRVAEYGPYSLWVVAIIATACDVALFGGTIIDSFLLYLLVLVVGVGSLYAFVGHAFVADEVARSIGWPPGTPFQFEVALHNLAVGILGLLCFWLRGNFWIATVIAFAVFGFGAAYGHIRDIQIRHNYSPGNAGVGIFINDVILPLLLIILLIAYIE